MSPLYNICTTSTTTVPSFACNLDGALGRRTTPWIRISPGHAYLPAAAARRIQRTAAQAPTERRSGNFQPNLWTDDYVQSHISNHAAEDEEENITRINQFKEDVKNLIYAKKEFQDQLQLIDHLQQLGVAYHFKDDIKDALRNIYETLEDIHMPLEDDIHATALLFRLLRENGFPISEDIFNGFKDEEGHLINSCLEQHRTEAMLSLYEASYYAKEGEILLNEAMDFTTKHLKRRLTEGSLEPHLTERVAHALELPLNWRMPRMHTRWFIEWCSQKETTINPLLIELAKRDFNALQTIHKKEIKELSTWWANIGLARKLPFFRDRLIENFLWTVGFAFEPEFGTFRELQTKSMCFTTLIDDVYDVHGTLDEVKLFTDVIDRWDVNAIDQLPEYMKLCFLPIFNMVNDIGYRITRDKGLYIIPHLKRAWGDLCKSFLKEAIWYHQEHKPTLEEYLDNAWTSITAPLLLTNAYCTSHDLSQEALACVSNYQDFARWTSLLCRFYDDFGTSTAELERGDVPKTIQCCMHERGVSEDVARQHIRELIMGYWRAINGDRASSCSFEDYFKRVAINLVRMGQFVFQHGDGYGKPDGQTKDQIISLFFQPIQI